MVRVFNALSVLGLIVFYSGMAFACSTSDVRQPIDLVAHFTDLGTYALCISAPWAVLTSLILLIRRKRWLGSSWQRLAKETVIGSGWILLGASTGILMLALLREMPLTRPIFYDPCAQSWITYVSLAFVMTFPGVFMAGQLALITTQASQNQ